MARRTKRGNPEDYTKAPGFERKTLAMVGVKVVNAAEGIVEAFVSGIGNVDDGGDIIEATFFESSLNKHLKKMPKVVAHHDWAQPIGKTLATRTVPAGSDELPEQLKAAGAGGQYVKMQFNLDTQRGAENFSDVVFFGDEQEWSIGYVPVGATKDKDGNRILAEGIWYESSPVLFGMNALTATVGAKGLLDIATDATDVEEAVTKLRESLEDDDAVARALVKLLRAAASDEVDVTADLKTPDEPESKQAVSGTYEERMQSVSDAVDTWINYVHSADPDTERHVWGWPVATFSDRVIACVVDDSAEKPTDARRYYEFEYQVGPDGSVTLGDPREVELETVVSPKWAAAIVTKVGRRHSKADEEALQTIHDSAVSLGASCDVEEEEEEEKVVATPDGDRALELKADGTLPEGKTLLDDGDRTRLDLARARLST